MRLSSTVRVAVVRYSLIAGLCGSVFVAFYLGFNALVFKSMFGRYADSIGVFRYDITTIPVKAYSIFWQSGIAYGEARQAFFEKAPLLAPALAICIVTAWLYPGIRRWIVISALLQFLLYLPYGDLLPTGVFRYWNLHYFKWTYPWIFVIAVGQLLLWGRSFAISWKPMAVSAAIVAAGACLSLVPVKIVAVADVRDQAGGAIAINLGREHRVDFIDLPGVTGDFPSVYFGDHRATLDGGREFNRREFRILPLPQGARLLFSRPTTLASIRLRLGPQITLGDSAGIATAYRLEFAFGCRFRRCADQG